MSLAINEVKLDIAVVLDSRTLARAICRLVPDWLESPPDTGRLRAFADALVEDLFIQDEEVADAFARAFSEAHTNHPRF